MLIVGIAAVAAVIAVLSGVCTGAFDSAAWIWVLPLKFIGLFVCLAALVFLALWFLAALVDTNKPQEKDSRLYRTVINLAADAACTILQMRIHTSGLEQLPKGRFLLVCNHIHDLDPVVLLSQLKKYQLAFISKRENTDKFIVGQVMHKIQCQLINRENDREAMKTILNCVKIIREDKASIAVFPEGYTSLDGLLHPFRHGVFKIAQRAQVPIVVFTVRDSNKSFQNALKLKPTKVELRLLKVLYPEDVKGMTAVQIGTMVHEMMANDLGEDLVLKETT